MGLNFTLQEFLDQVPKQKTKQNYKNNIERFSEWFKKSPEEILQMRKEDLTQLPEEDQIDFNNRANRFEREIVKYHSETLKRLDNINSARTYTVAIAQLFSYYRMPLMLSKSQKKISKTTKTTKSFPLTIEHVRRMFDVADLRERVVLSLATDLGLRISDFISLKIDDLPSLDDEPPIPLEVMTKKEDIVAHGFLSGETVGLLKIYLPTLNKKENPYIFPNTNGNHISDVWLNELIQGLAVDSKIQINGKALTFHCFRKMLLSASINSGIGLTAGKMIGGKSIPQSDGTYLTTVKLRELFIQLKAYLTIQSQIGRNSETVESLKTTISNLEKSMNEKLKDQQNIIEAHRQQLEKVQSILDQVKPTDQQYADFKRFNELVKNADDETYSKEIRPKVKTEIMKYGETLSESTGLSPYETIIELYLTNILDKMRET